jgi:hypothetical protein
MRWDPGHDSPDVIDRRGEGGGGGGIGMGALALLPLLLRSKVGWVILGLILVVSVFGGFFKGMIPGLGGDESRTNQQGQTAQVKGNDEMVSFVGFVLDDAQSTMRQKLSERGVAYRNAKLVLFTDATQTSCGAGRAATGPFYCPADERVYIDLGFFKELDRQFGAPGDFAQAYVIAHEIGHHVQHILGTSDRVHNARRSEQQGAEGLSVRLELQADCYAGIWGRSAEGKKLLDVGDLDEALRAAAAIGDDRLQKQASGRVSPEKWTHGSSAMRARWFKKGFESGDMAACDTFSASSL